MPLSSIEQALRDLGASLLARAWALLLAGSFFFLFITPDLISRESPLLVILGLVLPAAFFGTALVFFRDHFLQNH